MFNYDAYQRSDSGGQQLIMRQMFEQHRRLLERVDELEEKVRTMGDKNNNHNTKLTHLSMTGYVHQTQNMV